METTRARLSDKHAVLLAAFLGGPVLLGVGDPFLGYLAEEIPGEWAGCQEEVIRQGYGRWGRAGIELDGGLERMLKICLNPKGFVLAQPMDGSGALTVSFGAGGQGVSLDWQGGQVELALLGLQDRQSLLQRLEAFAGLSDRETAFPPFCLPAERWEALMRPDSDHGGETERQDMRSLLEQSHQRIARIAVRSQGCTLASHGNLSGTPPVFMSYIFYTGMEGNIKVRRYTQGLTDMAEISPLTARDFSAFLSDWV